MTTSLNGLNGRSPPQKRPTYSEAALTEMISRGDAQAAIDYLKQFQISRPASSRKRQRNILVISGVIAIVILGGGFFFLNRNTTKPTAPTGTSTATPTAAPAATIGSLEALNSVDEAVREIQDQEQALTAARSNHILTVAQRQASNNNTSIDHELRVQLNLKRLEYHQVLTKGELSGNAKDIATGRALLLDAKAILLAIKSPTKNEESTSLARTASLLEQVTNNSIRANQQAK
jgi:hypothetical protein